MIRFEPCQDWHIVLIDVQASQAAEKPYYMHAAEDIVKNSLALSCWLDDQCVGAAGIRPIWEGRATAWMLLGRNAGPAMAAITRKLQFVLATYPARRIELTVRSEFGAGCRLAALLGFDEEAAAMRGFFPDGTAARLFARIRG